MQYAVTSISSRLKTSDLYPLIEAARLYVLDACAEWGLPPWAVSYYDSLDALPADDVIPCLFMDQLDDPSAAAYHTLRAGRPVIDSLVDDPGGFLTHELAETRIDPDCEDWIPMPDGRMMAKEICDPVQGWSYEINGIKVSDFVLPSYFDPTGKAPFNFAATRGGLAITRPFEVASGGYAVILANGDETEVFGRVPGRKLLKPHGRLMRRLKGR